MSPGAEQAPRKVRFRVAPEDESLRLDQLLAKRVEGLSRTRARVVIDLGGVFVDRRRVKVASRKLRSGQAVELTLGGALERATKQVGRGARRADEAALPAAPVLFEDADLLVVNKPAGVLTAPTPESDRQNLWSILRRAAPGRTSLQVVHRLDLAASGVLVFAKSALANRQLSARFREHDIHRRYLAVVTGILEGEVLTLDEPIGGRRACTHVRILERIGTSVTLVEATLETGRTHQIRIHLASLGHPIEGDVVHGERSRYDAPRLALHAIELGFPHPRTDVPSLFKTPIDPEIDTWLQCLRARPGSMN